MSERDGDAYLQKRYGSSKPGQRRWVLPAVVLLVVGGSWLLWSANHYSKPEIRTELISFKVVSAKEVSLRYSISVRSTKRSHQCVLTASDYQANVVGQVTDVLPAGTTSINRTIAIPTRAAAASASIEHCS
jgi:hypothetical protein